MRWRVDNPFVTWRKWFAWYPIYVSDQWVWLEYVEYRLRYTIGGWDIVKDYRFIGEND